MNHALSLAYYYAGCLAFHAYCKLRLPGSVGAYVWLMGRSVRHDKDGRVWIPE